MKFRKIEAVICKRLIEHWRGGCCLLPWTSWRWEGNSDLDGNMSFLAVCCLEKFELWNVPQRCHDGSLSLWQSSKKDHLQTHNFGQWYVSGHPHSNLKPRGWFKLRIAVNLRETSGRWAFWCKVVVGNSPALRHSGFREGIHRLGNKTAKTYISSLKEAIINIGWLWATQGVFGDSIGIQLLI